MDWQQKAAALNALCRLEICLRGANDWYVHQGIEIGGNGMLTGEYGQGTTPVDAICDHWRKLVEELPEPLFLVTDATHAEKRRCRRWNGFMWADIQ